MPSKRHLFYSHRALVRLKQKIKRRGRIPVEKLIAAKSLLAGILRKIHDKLFTLRPTIIAYAHSGACKIQLAAEGDSLIYAPNFGSGSQYIFSDFPNVYAYLALKAHVSPYISGFLLGNKLALPSHIAEHRSDRILGSGTPALQLLSNGSYKVNTLAIRKAIDFQKVLVIGGCGATNWYHFVLEILPKLFLINQDLGAFPDFSLLAPSEYREHPTFRSALAYFSMNRTINYLNADELAFAQEAIIVDEVNIGPFNMRPGSWPMASDYKLNTQIIGDYASEFRRQLAAHPCKVDSPKRIFLARPSYRRSYNQDELMKIASRYEFSAIYLENFTLEEQASIFSNAQIVIGPSGAAWSGLIFASRSLRCLSWLPNEYSHFCCYSSLAALLKHKLWFIKAQTQNPLISSDQAYSEPYWVCPKDFEKMLNLIVEGE